MPNDPHYSRRMLSKSAFGAFVGAATFRPGRRSTALAADATPATSPEVCPTTTPQENETVVGRYWDEVWNKQLDATLTEIFAPDEIHHWGFADDTIGPAAFLAEIAGFRAAFPDFQIHVDQTISTGDFVVTRYHATATHQGVWHGIGATGNSVDYSGIQIFRIACGKIAESWGEADHLSLIEQLGGSVSGATPTT